MKTKAKKPPKSTVTPIQLKRPAEKVAAPTTEQIETMKAALRASVSDETPFVIPENLAPHQLAEYVNESLRRANACIGAALRNLANIASQQHANIDELHKVQSYLKGAIDGPVGTLEEHVRKLVTARIAEYGEPVEGTKAKQVTMNGNVHRIHPWRSTTDPKKSEALFNARGIPLEKAHNATVSYKPDELKLDAMVLNGELSKEERESLRYDLTWSLEKPRTIAEQYKLGQGPKDAE